MCVQIPWPRAIFPDPLPTTRGVGFALGLGCCLGWARDLRLGSAFALGSAALPLLDGWLEDAPVGAFLFLPLPFPPSASACSPSTAASTFPFPLPFPLHFPLPFPLPFAEPLPLPRPLPWLDSSGSLSFFGFESRRLQRHGRQQVTH